MMPDELVTVKTFTDAFEAELAQGLLVSSGIQVTLSGTHISRIANYLTPPQGGIQLAVRRSDEALARELLSTL